MRKGEKMIFNKGEGRQIKVQLITRNRGPRRPEPRTQNSELRTEIWDPWTTATDTYRLYLLMWREKRRNKSEMHPHNHININGKEL